jgi:hypothetical protein
VRQLRKEKKEKNMAHCIESIFIASAYKKWLLKDNSKNSFFTCFASEYQFL